MRTKFLAQGTTEPLMGSNSRLPGHIQTNAKKHLPVLQSNKCKSAVCN